MNLSKERYKVKLSIYITVLSDSPLLKVEAFTGRDLELETERVTFDHVPVVKIKINISKVYHNLVKHKTPVECITR